ncbi:patatin-like phospholipase domain-containing protein [Ditylenchus destructor]|nr:patatin-like phospholipase domain-containing protein [Ditylenchus destructor]
MLTISQICAIWLILSYSVDFGVFGNDIKNPNDRHVKNASPEKEREKWIHVKDVKNATLEENEPENPSSPDRRSVLNKMFGGIIDAGKDYADKSMRFVMGYSWFNQEHPPWRFARMVHANIPYPGRYLVEKYVVQTFFSSTTKIPAKNDVIDEIKLILFNPEEHKIKYGEKNPSAQIAMSLSGCGFMSTYHFGVVKAFHMHGKKFLSKVTIFAGTSAGSLVATLFALKQPWEVFEAAYNTLLDMGDEINETGNWAQAAAMFQTAIERAKYIKSPANMFKLAFTKVCTIKIPESGFPLAERLAGILGNKDFIPLEEHINLNALKDKLYISMTRLSLDKTKKDQTFNRLVSEFKSRTHLIECLMASCHIPYLNYMGRPAPFVDGEQVYDGGWSVNLPFFKDVPTITISPFSGSAIISPADKEVEEYNVGGQTFYANPDNIIRGGSALFPDREKLVKYHQDGYNDGLRFLTENGFNDDHKNMKNIS